MLIFTHRVAAKPDHAPENQDVLSLTAEERTRSRRRFATDSQREVALRLPRGTVLQDGDWLATSQEDYFLNIQAKPEPVITVRSKTGLDLLRAAYHLGNRHVPLEIQPDYLRLSPDPVLRSLLVQLGLDLQDEQVPFRPEAGAYHRGGHGSGHTHAYAHSHSHGGHSHSHTESAEAQESDDWHPHADLDSHSHTHSHSCGNFSHSDSHTHTHSHSSSHSYSHGHGHQHGHQHRHGQVHSQVHSSSYTHPQQD